MKREGLLLHASHLMADVDFAKCFKVHLCFWDDNLCCLPANHTKKIHTVFFAFEETIQRNGLTQKEWNSLNTNLWCFFKDKI